MKSSEKKNKNLQKFTKLFKKTFKFLPFFTGGNVGGILKPVTAPLLREVCVDGVEAGTLVFLDENKRKKTRNLKIKFKFFQGLNEKKK